MRARLALAIYRTSWALAMALYSLAARIDRDAIRAATDATTEGLIRQGAGPTIDRIIRGRP